MLTPLTFFFLDCFFLLVLWSTPGGSCKSRTSSWGLCSAWHLVFRLEDVGSVSMIRCRKCCGSLREGEVRPLISVTSPIIRKFPSFLRTPDYDCPHDVPSAEW
jgi:hypothetical protein